MNRCPIKFLLIGLMVVGWVFGYAVGEATENEEVMLKIAEKPSDPTGSTIGVLIDMDNSTAGEVAGVQIVLAYDGTVFKVKDVQRTDRTQDIEIFSFNVLPGQLRMAILSMGTKSIPAGMGPVARMIFEKRGTASERNFSFVVNGFDDTAVFDVKGNTYTLSILGTSGTTDISTDVSLASASFTPRTSFLFPNYPNPFNPKTQIVYWIAQAGAVELEVYNLNGQRVRRLVSSWRDAGTYTVYWDGRDARGEKAASGVYICSLRAEGYTGARKMILAK